MTNHTKSPEFSRSCSDKRYIKSNYKLDKYIVLFPFCSPHLVLKKWPYYNELIEKIKERYQDEYKIIVAPGPDEIREAEKINALYKQIDELTAENKTLKEHANHDHSELLEGLRPYPK